MAMIAQRNKVTFGIESSLYVAFITQTNPANRAKIGKQRSKPKNINIIQNVIPICHENTMTTASAMVAKIRIIK